MSIKKIGVVGAGTMGSGIAQAAAMSGYAVTIYDVAESQLQRGLQAIESSLRRLAEKEKITEDDVVKSTNQIDLTSELSGLANMDIVIEAAVENVDLKLALFADLDHICQPDALLVSNTSSISLTKLAGATSRPSRVCGMHFFNPVPLMKLVEVIRALQTSDETFSVVNELAKSLGKVAVGVKDSPGFVVNRMLVPMINEAVFLLYEGIASASEIDEAMKLGAHHPIGPLALADMIGIDVCLFVMEILHEEYGDSKYRACPLLKQKVHAGYLGRKSGRGFFEY